MNPSHSPDLGTLLAHASFVKAMAVGVLGGDSEVDDVVQETWLVALRSSPRRPDRLKSWLGGVSRRLALRSMRSAQRRESRHANAPHREGGPSVVEIAAREEARRRLVDAVFALPDPTREAILLRYFEGLSVREVADRQEVPLDTSKTRLRRGLETLRTRLDEEHGGDRGRWARALVPWALPSAGAATGVGALVLVGGLLLAGGVSAVLWQALRGEPDRARTREAASVGGSEGGVLEANPTLKIARWRGTGAIVGRVTQEGLPAAGTDLELVGVDDDALAMSRGAGAFALFGRPFTLGSATLARATADAGGGFAFEGWGRGLYFVRAARATTKASSSVFLPLDGARVEASAMALEPATESLTLRLVRSDAAPWPARLVAFRVPPLGGYVPWPFPEAGPVATDDDGACRLTGLQAGTWVVFAIGRDGDALIRGDLRAPSADAVVIEVPASTPARPGLVRSRADGSPVPRARVLALAQLEGRGEMRAFIHRATSDAEGRFEVPDRTKSFFVEADGFSPAIPDGSPLRDPIVIELDRSARLRGRATRISGEPAPGLDVTVTPSGRQSTGMAYRATTDATGTYVVEGIPPGEVALQVAGPGAWARGESLDGPGHEPLVVSLSPGETGALDVVVAVAARLEGRVVDAAGSPVVGAVVTATENSPSRSTDRRGVLPLSQQVVTSREGTFVLDPLPPAASIEVAVAVAGSSTERVAVTLSEDASAVRTPLVVKVKAPRRVVVRIVEAGTHTPVAGVRVDLYRRSGEGWRGEGAGAVSDARGLAVIDRAPRGALAANVLGARILEERNVKELPGSEADDDTLEAVREVRLALSIDGRVVGEDGAPLAGARVEASQGPSSHATSRAPGATGRDGKFHLDGLVAGDVTIRAFLEEGLEKRVGVVTATAGAGDVVVRVAREAQPPPRARLQVRVVDGEGKPVPRFWLQRYRQRLGGWFADSGSGGRAGVSSSDVPIEAGLVEAMSAQTEDGRPLPLAPSRAELPVGTTALTLRMLPDLPTSGRVLDAGGAAIPGVKVAARRAPETGWVGDPSDPYGRARTDASGAFTLRGLGKGRWRLVWEVPPSFVVPEDVIVEGGTGDIGVVLAAAARPWITVVGPDREAVAGAMVAATSTRRAAEPAGVHPAPIEEMRASGTTDAQGRVRLDRLPADGSFTLSIRPATGKALPKLLPSWKPVDTEILLEKALRLRGVLRDPQGRPVTHAMISWLSDPPAGWTGGTISSEGAFDFANVPAGETRIHVEMGDVPSGVWAGKEFVVRGGDEGLVLVVDPGLSLQVRVTNVPQGSAGPWLFLRPSSASANGAVPRAIPDPQGLATFYGLAAGTKYELVARSMPGGLTLRRADVVPGSAPLELALEPGGTVRGRLLLPAGATDARVTVGIPGGSWISQATAGADGEFTVEGVPEGEWSIDANARVGEKWVMGRGTAVAGQRVEIDLRGP